VYELLNEPVETDAQLWRETSIRLVKAIRAVDAKHTIIVYGHNWSGPDDLLAIRPIEDDNIMTDKPEPVADEAVVKALGLG
jgi:endoglucanase